MRVRTLLAGAAAGFLASAALAAPAFSQVPDPEVTLPPIPAIKGLPIPSLPTDLLVPKFIGTPASEPVSYTHLTLPTTPYV